MRLWYTLLLFFLLLEVFTAQFSHAAFQVNAVLTPDRIAHIQIADIQRNLASPSILINIFAIAKWYFIYCLIAVGFGLLLSLFVKSKEMAKKHIVAIGLLAFFVPLVQPVIYYATNAKIIWQPPILWVCGFFMLIVPALVRVTLWVRATPNSGKITPTMSLEDRQVIRAYAAGDASLCEYAIQIHRKWIPLIGVRGSAEQDFMAEIDNPAPDLMLLAQYRDRLLKS